MRHFLAIALASAVALVGCGGDKKSGAGGDGGGGGDSQQIDAAPLHDAPPLAACTPQSGTTMSTRMIGRVSERAILVTAPPNDGRLFVIEAQGRIRVFENEQLKPDAFLDITQIPNFAQGGEQGLLGLTFHPNYANNNYFYVWYTTGSCPGNPPAGGTCANVLERFTTSSADPNKADMSSGVVILSIPDFATNHNAGMLEFGSDGYLYVSTGDGGAGGDPAKNGQNANALLGKMLRLDVDHPSGGKMYGIPADNPFANGTSGAPEVFMRGLRNPWRWSFDRGTGDMWIADVGQDAWEELDAIPAAQQNGANMGWSMYEATHCYNSGNGNGTCSTTGITMPQFEHAHANGWSAIIGGQVYRGPCYPDLVGSYFFSDYSAHPLMKTKLNAGGTIDTPVDVSPAGGFVNGPSAIHADARGELYVTTTDGYVYHLEAGP